MKEGLQVREIQRSELLQYHKIRSTATHVVYPDMNDAEGIKKRLDSEYEESLEKKSFWKKNEMMWVGAFRGEQMVAGLKVFPHTVNFDGNFCEMAGVGGVLSDPLNRRNGAITAIFRQLFAECRQNGQYFSHLYPFITQFYKKYGYESTYQKVFWQIPIEYLPTEPCSGLVHYEATDRQKEDIKKVYRLFSEKRNMSGVRTEERWEEFFRQNCPYTQDRYCYLHYDEAGNADGFFGYTMRYPSGEGAMADIGGTIYFTCAKALQQMLAFLTILSSYAKEVCMVLPGDVDITGILGEICGRSGRRVIQRKVFSEGMSRVIDAEEVLKLARYRGEGSVKIKLTDDFCEWNNKCFLVTFDGVCKSVSYVQDYDICMDIRAFAAMILGKWSMEDCEYQPGIKVIGNRENLGKVFYKKSFWIGEDF